MKTITTISESANYIKTLIQEGIQKSVYFNLEINNKIYKIRVSNHSCNDLNNVNSEFDGFFSFTTEWNKQKRNSSNEFVLTNDGEFTEEFRNIEECLDWHIN